MSESAARQFVSSVAEATSAIKAANTEVLSSQIADSVVVASQKTLETIHKMEANHAQVVAVLQSKIATYETSIAAILKESVASVEAAVANAAADGPEVAAILKSLLQISLHGEQQGAEGSNPEEANSIHSISDWFRKVTADSQKTIAELSGALTTVTSEREQFRAELAHLKATSVPMADLQTARLYIAKLEGDLITASAEASEMQMALGMDVAKGLASHAAEKAVWTAEIESLRSTISGMNNELTALRSTSNAAWERDSAAVHRQTLADALAEAETAALAAVDARAKLSSIPQIEQQFEASASQIRALINDKQQHQRLVAALNVDLTATLHQNAVLTQQLACALTANTKFKSEQAAKSCIAAAGKSSAQSITSTSVVRKPQWLFLSGAQNGNVATMSNSAPYEIRHEKVFIGQKSLRSRDEQEGGNLCFGGGKNFPSMATNNDASSPVMFANMSAASATVVASAIKRCGTGAAVGLSDHSSDEDDTASGPALQHLESYGIDTVASLVEQNSLLACMLFEQRHHWTKMSVEMQKIASYDPIAFAATFGIASSAGYEALESNTAINELSAWAKQCLEASASAGNGPSKRLRTERAQSVTVDVVAGFEDTLIGATSALLASLREEHQRLDDSSAVADDFASLPDMDMVINGSGARISGLVVPKLESYSSIKAELRKLLNFGAAHKYGDDNDGEDSDDDEDAAGYTEMLDTHKLLKDGKIFVSSGTSPDYALLATEGLRANEARGGVADNNQQLSSARQASVNNNVAATGDDLKRRADILAAATVAAVTTWTGMFAAHVDNANPTAASYRSVTDITLSSLRDSLTAYSTICTEQDCELLVLRTHLDAANKEREALRGELAVSASADITNFNALQMLAEYLGQAFVSIGNGSFSQQAATGHSSTSSPNARTGPLSTDDAGVVAVFANVLETLNATASREETLADIFVRACAAFATNPELSERLAGLRLLTRRCDEQHDSTQSDSNAHPGRLVTMEGYETYTFDNWRIFTSSNAAIGATNPGVEAELRAALESETTRANYFQEKFESNAAQQEQWMEQLFTTDQKCEDLGVQLAEAQSVMVSKDEHSRVLLEFEAALARRRQADDAVASLQTSLNSRDADITKLVIKCQELEDQLMKNDADHRAYEQGIQAQIQEGKRRERDLEGRMTQQHNVLAQTQRELDISRQVVANRDDRLARMDKTLQTLQHESILDAYRSGILAEMFPDAEQALVVALEAAETKRFEATNVLTEVASLQAQLDRSQRELQRSDAALSTESAQRQRLQLLLSDSEATVRSYYENVEEAMSALKVRCEALERQLASVTRERDATALREQALFDQVEVLSSDPSTANVRRYGLAATRLFESQMSELNDRYVATQASLADTQEQLASTISDRDAKVDTLSAQKAAVEEALEAQQNIVTQLAEEREQLRLEQNDLKNQHQQLQFTANRQEACIRDLSNEKSALQKRNTDSETAVGNLRADIESYLLLTEELRVMNGKLQASEAAAKRLNEELKKGHDILRNQVQEATSAAASATRGRPPHRQLQVRPSF